MLRELGQLIQAKGEGLRTNEHDRRQFLRGALNFGVGVAEVVGAEVADYQPLRTALATAGLLTIILAAADRKDDDGSLPSPIIGGFIGGAVGVDDFLHTRR